MDGEADVQDEAKIITLPALKLKHMRKISVVPIGGIMGTQDWISLIWEEPKLSSTIVSG